MHGFLFTPHSITVESSLIPHWLPMSWSSLAQSLSCFIIVMKVVDCLTYNHSKLIHSIYILLINNLQSFYNKWCEEALLTCTMNWSCTLSNKKVQLLLTIEVCYRIAKLCTYLTAAQNTLQCVPCFFPCLFPKTHEAIQHLLQITLQVWQHYMQVVLHIN